MQEKHILTCIKKHAESCNKCHASNNNIIKMQDKKGRAFILQKTKL